MNLIKKLDKKIAEIKENIRLQAAYDEYIISKCPKWYLK